MNRNNKKEINPYKPIIEKKILQKLLQNKNKSVNKILFMPTNGCGLGHVTRTLAVARRLKEMHPNVEIIFFTTSFALNIIQKEGFLSYYFPSMDFFPDYIPQKDIDDDLEEQLIKIVKRHKIDTLVYDGVYPYACLVNAIEKSSLQNTIWIQRGMHKSGKTPIEREDYFNLIIVPGEANKNYNAFQKNSRFQYCPPIVYSYKEELLPKEFVLNMWNLDPDKKTVYIQLGEGLYEDINSLIFKIIEVLKKNKDLQIVLGESIIAHKRYPIDPNIFIIRDYPNSIYFNAFDFAIITGSYNTFHEAIYFGVPTILFPTKVTGTDDQIARAKIAEELGTGFVFTDFNPKKFKNAVSKILNPNINQSMRNNSKDVFENGAYLAAKYIVESI
jgi:UDP:flavonoid glycosyltransferase YjiC (YdhE family)